MALLTSSQRSSKLNTVELVTLVLIPMNWFVMWHDRYVEFETILAGNSLASYEATGGEL